MRLQVCVFRCWIGLTFDRWSRQTSTTEQHRTLIKISPKIELVKLAIIFKNEVKNFYLLSSSSYRHRIVHPCTKLVPFFLFLIWANPGLFLFIFVLFKSQFKCKLKKLDVVLGIWTRGFISNIACLQNWWGYKGNTQNSSNCLNLKLIDMENYSKLYLKYLVVWFR